MLPILPAIPGRRSLAAAVAAASLLTAFLVTVPGASALRPAPALTVCCGLTAEVYATGLERPTALAFGPDGLLYATQETGEVVAVGPGSSKPRILARGFKTPLGLAWSGSTLYVSAQGSVQRLAVDGKRVVSRKTIVNRLPFGRHQQDTIVVGPDRRLYLGSGTTCDVCREKDRRSGAILSFRSDGSDLRIVATGLRNPFGLIFDGDTLYVSDNARDDLGKNEPAETVVRIRPGADYGWPDCWASWQHRRLQGSCRGVAPPVAYLEPHSSADSLALWAGKLIVAEWGQYLSERWGRKLVQVDVRTGRSSTFADGFEHPLGLAVEPRNHMKTDGVLAGDWGRGVIYRFRKR